MTPLSPYRLLIEVIAAMAFIGAVFAMGHQGGVKAEHQRMQAKLDQVQAAWADERANLQAAAENAERQARAQEQQRAAKAQEQDHEDLAHAEHRADAAVASAAAADRLRQRTEILAASCGAATSDPAASAVSPAASGPGDLLADVQRRVVEAAGRIAQYADASHDAAQSCAARYDALK